METEVPVNAPVFGFCCHSYTRRDSHASLVGLGGCIYQDGLPARRRSVTHLTTNQDRRRITSYIQTNAAATKPKLPNRTHRCLTSTIYNRPTCFFVFIHLFYVTNSPVMVHILLRNVNVNALILDFLASLLNEMCTAA